MLITRRFGLILSFAIGNLIGPYVRGRNDGRARWAQIPGRQITLGAPNYCSGAEWLLGALKSPNNVTSTFFSAVHLLPKDLRFEHEGAKLASCPRRHLTLLRPCIHVCQVAITAACGWGRDPLQCRRLLWDWQTQLRPSSHKVLNGNKVDRFTPFYVKLRKLFIVCHFCVRV